MKKYFDLTGSQDRLLYWVQSDYLSRFTADKVTKRKLASFVASALE